MQTASPARLRALFGEHRQALLTLSRQMPEYTAGWRPWSDGRTTLGLLNHLIESGEFFQSAAQSRPMLPVPVAGSVAEAARLLRQSAAGLSGWIDGLSPEELARTVTVPLIHVQESVADVILRMILHEAHHKGQLWLYARMQGLQPPLFVHPGT